MKYPFWPGFLVNIEETSNGYRALVHTATEYGTKVSVQARGATPEAARSNAHTKAGKAHARTLRKDKAAISKALRAAQRQVAKEKRGGRS